MSLKILIADDSKFSQKIIKEIVQSVGHKVIACVSDGLQALEEYKKQNPDIVLLDITMPNMSGKECLIEILKINQLARVVMISALTNPELESECLKIGAKFFLSKAMNENPDYFKEKIIKTLSVLTSK